MIKFKHKDTGEEISLSHIRTYYKSDGTTYNVDVSSKYDLKDYIEIKHKGNYKAVNVTKAPNDRIY